MGQRLLISCVHNNECIAKIYYHWSAYTLEAFDEAAHIMKFITPDILNNTDKILLRIIVALYSKSGEGISTGGLCTPVEAMDGETYQSEKQIEYIKEHFPELYSELVKEYEYTFGTKTIKTNMFHLITKGTINRNLGMMCVVPEHFHYYEERVEGELEINFDTKMIYNKIIKKYDKDEFDELFRTTYEGTYKILTDFQKKALFFALDDWLMPSDFTLDAVPFNKINYAVSILLAHMHTHKFMVPELYLDLDHKHAIQIKV